MFKQYKNKLDSEFKDLEYLQQMILDLQVVEPDIKDYQKARSNLLHELTSPKEEESLMSKITTTVMFRPIQFTLTGIIILSLVALLVFNPFGGSVSNIYAHVAEQLRNAKIITFDAEWNFNNQVKPTQIKMAFFETSIQRKEMNYNGARLIQINNTVDNKGLMIMPDDKAYFLTDLTELQPNERESISLLNTIQRNFRELPREADEFLSERVVDGKLAHGYRVGNKVFWIDHKENQLVLLEINLGPTWLLMKNFQIDPPDFGEEKFQLDPPEGFAKLNSKALKIHSEEPNVQHLIQYLKSVAQMRKDQQFPETTNPMEILTLQKKGLLISESTVNQEEQDRKSQEFAQSAQNTVLFVIGMKPENDWNYSGKGIRFGDSKRPVAWWKTDTIKGYQVIWGDLTITIETSEKVSTFNK